MKNSRIIIRYAIFFLLLSSIIFSSQNSFAQEPSKIEMRLNAVSGKDTQVVQKKKSKKKESADTSLVNSDLPDVGKANAPNQTEGVINKRKTENVQQDSLVKKNKIKKSSENEWSQSVTDTIEKKELTTEEKAKELMESAFSNMTGNNFDQAVIYYSKVIADFSSTAFYIPAYYYRAKCNMSLNEQESALKDISRFISLDNCNSPLCSDAYYFRANIYFNSGRYADANADFTAAAKDSIYKNYKFCFFYRGLGEGELNQHIQSVQDFTKFLNLDNYKTLSSAEALYYRGFYKVKLDDNRGAIKDYDKAIDLYKVAIENTKEKKQMYLQKLIDTYITRALAKAEIKKFEEAIADYNEVLKLNPNYATAYRLKGLAEIGKGDLDKGCLDLSKAGELGSLEAYEDIKMRCK